jgi:hypothetical protein
MRNSQIAHATLDIGARLNLIKKMRTYLDDEAIRGNKWDALGRTCRDGNIELVWCILELDHVSNYRPDSYERPLVAAFFGGHLDLAVYLIFKWNAQLNVGEYIPDLKRCVNALGAAVVSGNMELVRLLLYRGAHNRWLNHHYAPVVLEHAASEDLKHPSMLVEIVEHGYPANNPEIAKGFRLLWPRIASQHWQSALDLAEILLARGFPTLHPAWETSGRRFLPVTRWNRM